MEYQDHQAWIEACERGFFEQLDEVARALCARRDLKLIRLSGPTCSGKTTASELLAARFAERGKRLHLISIDDFYFDKDVLHANFADAESGRVDYDSVKTIDLATLASFVEELFSEGEAHCPIFDFREGRRVGYRPLRGGEDDVFVFEGIQAVYPEVTALFAASGHLSVGVYIVPCRGLSAGEQTVEPNELRLLRRIVRDYHFRGTDADFTLTLWQGVRKNEEEHIFPYANGCDCFIDSTMEYELGVLKPFLCRILPTVPKDSPNRERAEQLLALIAPVEPISHTLIPEGSLYREFV